jgi:hypothetical protein
MKNYNKLNFFKLLSIFLILFSVIFFFYGFLVEENSAGAGGFKGDFANFWITLQTFLNNDILTSVKISGEVVMPGQERLYISSRPPLIFIINKLFNPFVETKIIFIRSIFFFSLLAPILFYYSLKIKYPKINNIILILLSCTILLSPYFRTSSYWALEENYGIVFIFISFILLEKFFIEKKIRILSKFIKLFFLTFVSSLCVYFDQKLLIIPLFCFIKIIFSNEEKFLKYLTFLLYFIFSIPFLYLIFLWENIIPTIDASTRTVGHNFYLSHAGFSLTIIGFYFIPLFFFKRENIKTALKSYFKDKTKIIFFLFFVIYLFFSFFFDDYQSSAYPMIGKGVIHKLSLLLFKDHLIQKFFVYFNFIIFYFIITLMLDKRIAENLIIFYFTISSIFITPILQEYYDPIILIIVFIFFNLKLKINYKNTCYLFFYLLFFLIIAKIHYLKIFPFIF